MALDPALRARATLVIVGGNLQHPSAAEISELGRIRAVLAAQPELADAIVLLGHRPNQEVADLLGAIRYGVTGLIGPNGAYACASRKEEFGLAIIEALAAGLPVVAPLAGGPRTYVENGRTGWLVDTTSPHELAWGMGAALDLSDRPGRATYAAEMVAREYDISAMARTLTTVYSGVSTGSVEWLAS